MALLERIEPNLLSGALQIVRALRSDGFEALFAGGLVRDVLLGREVSDIDIATSAPPDRIEELFPHTIAVGKEFGVIIVVINSVNYEVATYRKDSEYLDGRHPSKVVFTEVREDALRRDFTVNALFLDPESKQVIDHVNGLRDLEMRVIRTVGDPSLRFIEDNLRMLRAVRFACDLDFEIDKATYIELKKRASEILRVSWERIRDELLKILTGRAPHKGLDLLLDTGLLKQVLPEVSAMVGVEQPPQFHPEGDVFIHTRLMLEMAQHPSETLALGILLHDVGKPPTFQVKERIRFDGHAEVGAGMAEAICRRLRLSKEKQARVVSLVKEHLRFMHVKEMRESTLRRFLRRDEFDEHLKLHRLDCLASHKDLTNYDFCVAHLKGLAEETMRPEPLLNGHDLIEMGFKPGPIFGQILTALEDRQLEDLIGSREEAMEWVRENWAHAHP